MWRISAADGSPKTIPAVSAASINPSAAASGAPRSPSRAGPVTWAAFQLWKRQPRHAKKESSFLTSSWRASTWHIPNKRAGKSRMKRSGQRPDTLYIYCIQTSAPERSLSESNSILREQPPPDKAAVVLFLRFRRASLGTSQQGICPVLYTLMRMTTVLML